MLCSWSSANEAGCDRHLYRHGYNRWGRPALINEGSVVVTMLQLIAGAVGNLLWAWVIVLGCIEVTKWTIGFLS